MNETRSSFRMKLFRRQQEWVGSSYFVGSRQVGMHFTSYSHTEEINKLMNLKLGGQMVSFDYESMYTNVDESLQTIQ